MWGMLDRSGQHKHTTGEWAWKSAEAYRSIYWQLRNSHRVVLNPCMECKTIPPWRVGGCGWVRAEEHPIMCDRKLNNSWEAFHFPVPVRRSVTGCPRFVGFFSPHQQMSAAEMMLQSADIDMTCGKSDRTFESKEPRRHKCRRCTCVISRLENLSVLNIGHLHGCLKQQHVLIFRLE